MIVVADTSPISALLKINRADLLPKLYGEVLIPTAVRAELFQRHRNLPDWLKVVAVKDRSSVELLRSKLDLGESEAIQLGKELLADRVLMDESKGRTVAQREGLQVIGLVGVVVLAKTEGLISSVSDMIAELRSRANVYLSDDIIEAAKKAAGE